MFCLRCGATITAEASICPACGIKIQPAMPVPGPPPEPPAAIAPLPTPMNVRTDGGAIGSLVLGILAVFPFGFLAGIPAIILGHAARARIRQRIGELNGQGMALAGLIMGYFSLLLIPLVILIAVVAIPNFIRARQVSNERAAAQTLKTTADAIELYKINYDVYPASLDALAPDPAGGSPTKEAAGLLDNNLINGLKLSKAGYRFSYTPSGLSFSLHADPVDESAGIRHFMIDETGVVREDRNRAGRSKSDISVTRDTLCSAWVQRSGGLKSPGGLQHHS